jgi:hypothetical protein
VALVPFGEALVILCAEEESANAGDFFHDDYSTRYGAADHHPKE